MPYPGVVSGAGRRGAAVRYHKTQDEGKDIAAAQAGPSRQWQRLVATFRTGTHTQVRFQLFGGALGERRESAVGSEPSHTCPCGQHPRPLPPM